MSLLWQQRIIVWIWPLLLAGCLPRGGAWTPGGADPPVVRPALPAPRTAATHIPWRVAGGGEVNENGWSAPSEVVPKLRVAALTADKSSPQKAGLDAIAWQVAVEGGVPPLVYEFISRHDGREIIEQRGKSPVWQWQPLERGRYQIMARVHDGAGNTVVNEQSVSFEILAPLEADSLIAVLPVQNMSGARMLVKKIQAHLENMVRQKGMRLVDAQVLQDFMARHRLRYTAGIDGRLAQALREETGADAVLFSTLELYGQHSIPKISLTAWLDRCGDQPHILWIDSKGLSGDESPGLLDLGMVRQADRLWDKVLASLFESWDQTLMPAAATTAAIWPAAYREQRWQDPGGGKFRPRMYYRSAAFSPMRRYTVAVMPFYNLSERKYAGELMALHFVSQLRNVSNLTVIEPGELRQYLLRYRIIMEDGLSLANAEVLFAKLGVDLIVSGKIFDYEDYAGPVGKPIVDFSVEIFSRDGNQTLWTSKSYTDGDKGVFFFDLGKVYTAHNLAGLMVGTIAEMLEQSTQPGGSFGGESRQTDGLLNSE
jgi:hypothetical protein